MADKIECSSSRTGLKRAHRGGGVVAHHRHHHHLPADGHAHLRRVLGIMFPPAYIRLFHQPPHSVCSLFSLKLCAASQRENSGVSTKAADDQHRAAFEDKMLGCEPSTEPSSRAQVIHLQNCLQESLVEHRAKPVGLCPIRRAIYEQCFDELIRQVTVGCIEQGLLLFRIRNEFRMTIGCYRRAYESAVLYGLNKAVDASLKLSAVDPEREAQTKAGNHSRGDTVNSKDASNADNENIVEFSRLESKLKEYYESELANKNEVIAQQRAIIKAFNQKP